MASKRADKKFNSFFSKSQANLTKIVNRALHCLIMSVSWTDSSSSCVTYCGSLPIGETVLPQASLLMENVVRQLLIFHALQVTYGFREDAYLDDCLLHYRWLRNASTLGVFCQVVTMPRLLFNLTTITGHQFITVPSWISKMIKKVVFHSNGTIFVEHYSYASIMDRTFTTNNFIRVYVLGNEIGRAPDGDPYTGPIFTLPRDPNDPFSSKPTSALPIEFPGEVVSSYPFVSGRVSSLATVPTENSNGSTKRAIENENASEAGPSPKKPRNEIPTSPPNFEELNTLPVGKLESEDIDLDGFDNFFMEEK